MFGALMLAPTVSLCETSVSCVFLLANQQQETQTAPAERAYASVDETLKNDLYFPRSAIKLKS
jgi:hypothetical protein